MSKIAVIYWSGTGNTEAMADLVANAAAAAGASVDKFTASEFNVSSAGDYTGFALGCPAMGAEQLEESEFEPMFSDLEGSLNGKKIGPVRLLRLGRRPVDARLGTAYQRRKRCHLHR